MATILLTGAAGFIGAWTARALHARGDAVIGIDNFNDYYDVSLKRDRVKTLATGCDIREADMADYATLEKVFQTAKIDQVCHVAAQAGVRHSLENPFVYERANVLGTLNLLELCRHHGVKSFVYASSSSVYGGNKKVPFSVEDRVDQPLSLYAATKRADELMAHAYHHLFGIACTGLRFFTVYGPWGRPDMAYFKFTHAILKGKPIDVYNHGKMKRDFTYITDVVAGILAALDRNRSFDIFNLGNSTPIELVRLIELIEKELGRKAETHPLPLQPGDVPVTCADIESSRKKLGFEPKVSLEEGIRNFVDWYKEYHRIS